MKYFLPFINVLAALVLIAFFYTNLSRPQTDLAPETLAAINTVGGIPYYLYGSGVNASDTSITLTSFKQPSSGYKLSMSDFGTIGYLTLEPGNVNRQEFVSFTGVSQNSDGSATVTGVTRGLAPVSPYTASTTLQKAHGGGTVAIISNPPQLYEQFLSKYNTGTSTAVTIFSSTTPPRYDHTGAQSTGTYIATTSELVSWDGLMAVTNAGTVNGTEAVKGIWEGATALEQASSTILGATGAGLVMQSRHATDTPLYGCAVGYTGTAGAGCSPIALLTGKLKQSWFNLTEHWSFSSLFATNASSTNATTTSQYITGLTSELIKADANGQIVEATVGTDYAYVTRVNTSVSNATSGGTASTTVFSFNVPANTLGSTGAIVCELPTTLTSSLNSAATGKFSVGYGTGTTTANYTITNSAGSTNAAGITKISVLGAGATNSQNLLLYGSYGMNGSLTGTDDGSVGILAESTISTDSTATQTLMFEVLEAEASDVISFYGLVCTLTR